MPATVPYSNLAWHSLTKIFNTKQTNTFFPWATKSKGKKKNKNGLTRWQECSKNICSMRMKISLSVIKVNRTGFWNSAEGTDIGSSLGALFLKKGHAPNWGKLQKAHNLFSFKYISRES